MPKSFRHLRSTAFKQQDGLCFYCNQLMWLTDITAFSLAHGITVKQARAFQCTAEHLIARCDGGRHSTENIVAACLYCNQGRHRRKNPLGPDRYRALMQQRLIRGKMEL